MDGKLTLQIKRLSQRVICHSERSEESRISDGQTLRFAQGDSFEIVSNTCGCNRRKFHGLTLVEVIIASALLVVAIIPILKGLTTVHSHTIMVEQRTMSLVYAQAKLDDIKARSVYSYDSNFAETSYVITGSYLGTVEDDQDPNLRTIRVSVGYDVDDNNSLSSDEVKVSLATYIAKRW
jgi:Tfp pilus assembly protein PilV